MSLPCLLQGRHRCHCLLRHGSEKLLLSFGDWGCRCCLWRRIPSYSAMCGWRSLDQWHIDEFDVLLVVAIKNLEVSSPRRKVASSGSLGTVLLQPLVRWSCVEGLPLTPATKTTGRHPCLDQNLIFLFCEGAFIRVAV